MAQGLALDQGQHAEPAVNRRADPGSQPHVIRHEPSFRGLAAIPLSGLLSRLTVTKCSRTIKSLGCCSRIKTPGSQPPAGPRWTAGGPWRTIRGGTSHTKGSDMELEFMWKDAGSHGGNCPAMYRTKGGYVVQGKVLDAETRAQLRDLGGDEDGVFVPDNVIDRIRGLA